ncbi:hypothetical protein SCAR479_10700 [Seiridium cardinale]|uniref:Uncharacterized protein n=1 Tax=Seiridium cardinale TaxID=138064 RepID=A0ABR2XFT5_9PEZI
MKRFGPANHWLELQYDENTPTPTASSPWDSNLAPSSSKGKPPGHCAAALMQTGGLGLGDQQGLTPTQVVPTTGQYILRAANQGGCGSALECEFEGEFEHPAAAASSSNWSRRYRGRGAPVGWGSPWPDRGS